MSNPFLAGPEPTNAAPVNVRTYPEFDDDDDDAADDDDDENLVSSSGEHWSSLSGFGSPEWWSRH